MTEPKYLDAFGTPLAEGDIVAHMTGYGNKDLVPCEVVGFTPKMLRLRRLQPRSTEPVRLRDGSTYEGRANACQCVRIDVKAYLGLAS